MKSRTRGDSWRLRDGGRILAGPDGGWINGQVLRANGGII